MMYTIDTRKSVSIKRQLLELRFYSEYSTWRTCSYQDDRQLFCNIYTMLMQSLDTMVHVDNAFVWTAYNREFDAQFKYLEQVKRKYRNARISR